MLKFPTISIVFSDGFVYGICGLLILPLQLKLVPQKI